MVALYLERYLCWYASPYHFDIGWASQVAQATNIHYTPSQADRFVAGKRQ